MRGGACDAPSNQCHPCAQTRSAACPSVRRLPMGIRGNGPGIEPPTDPRKPFLQSFSPFRVHLPLQACQDRQGSREPPGLIRYSVKTGTFRFSPSPCQSIRRPPTPADSGDPAEFHGQNDFQILVHHACGILTVHPDDEVSGPDGRHLSEVGKARRKRLEMFVEQDAALRRNRFKVPAPPDSFVTLSTSSDSTSS